MKHYGSTAILLVALNYPETVEAAVRLLQNWAPLANRL